MILRFCSGSATPLQVPQELLARVHVDHLDAEVAGEGAHHLLRLVEPQQAMVDEHAGELLADRLVDQRRGHRRIHAAGQPEDDFFRADLRADAR